MNGLTILFKCDTMGAHHSVTSVMGAMMHCSCKRSNSALSVSLNANGIDLGERMPSPLEALHDIRTPDTPG